MPPADYCSYCCWYPRFLPPFTCPCRDITTPSSYGGIPLTPFTAGRWARTLYVTLFPFTVFPLLLLRWRYWTLTPDGICSRLAGDIVVDLLPYLTVDLTVIVELTGPRYYLFITGGWWMTCYLLVAGCWWTRRDLCWRLPTPIARHYTIIIPQTTTVVPTARTLNIAGPRCPAPFCPDLLCHWLQCWLVVMVLLLLVNPVGGYAVIPPFITGYHCGGVNWFWARFGELMTDRDSDDCWLLPAMNSHSSNLFQDFLGEKLLTLASDYTPFIVDYSARPIAANPFIPDPQD